MFSEYLVKAKTKKVELKFGKHHCVSWILRAK